MVLEHLPPVFHSVLRKSAELRDQAYLAFDRVSDLDHRVSGVGASLLEQGSKLDSLKTTLGAVDGSLQQCAHKAQEIHSNINAYFETRPLMFNEAISNFTQQGVRVTQKALDNLEYVVDHAGVIAVGAVALFVAFKVFQHCYRVHVQERNVRKDEVVVSPKTEKTDSKDPSPSQAEPTESFPIEIKEEEIEGEEDVFHDAHANEPPLEPLEGLDQPNSLIVEDLDKVEESFEPTEDLKGDPIEDDDLLVDDVETEVELGSKEALNLSEPQALDPINQAALGG